MYESDSFFTLSQSGQIGLLVLSLVLFLGTLYASWRLSANKPLVLRLVIGLVLLFLFSWLSPQAYYQYYRMIIDGLPQQIVVRMPSGPLELLQLLTFQADANLSAHSKGVLGWALLIVSGLRRNG
ncbi:MAG: hypothetical protein ABJN34_05850 [Litoreibacter sp.]|uniref:hypothetical protein n=1 Tax=Litoreibacter sp. TaxID=1969459 RepID=UPI003299EE7C